MSNVLKGLQPEAIWRHFEQICAIPHPSKHELELAEYVRDWGKSIGLETVMDETGNVFICKPATPGYENRMGVILQGHLDMVPQKNGDTTHDFEKDPIQPWIDGEWVKAKGTTLGSDNGIGVAAAMAVLEAKDIQHGPIEALFTIDEETGMTGAFGLKPGFLNGDILINMDSEDEGELYIGCAGGMNTNAKYHYTEEDVPVGMKAYKINISGLKGGHSGLDIHLGRGNSNKIMNRILWHASHTIGLRLASIDGGSLRNAIPRESFAVVVVPAEKEQQFIDYVKEFTTTVKSELSVADPDLKIVIEPVEVPAKLIDEKTQENLIRGVYGCPNGAITMVADMPEVVETSTNLAIVKSNDGVIEVCTLQRSSIDSCKDDLGNMVRTVFEMAGAEVEHSGNYPGWKPDLNSPILKKMKETYQNLYNKTPEVKVIHAGLECGIIGDVYPGMDMISFGPTIRFPHSPDEKVSIPSVEKFWNFLINTLKNIPAK